MKILLFGGSFDPPHKGHEQLLVAALKNLKPDRVFLVPTRISPLKDSSPAPSKRRLGMLRLLRDRLPRRWRRKTELSLFEIRRKGPSFTFKTLRHFRIRFPACEIYFLAGSDALADFPRWKRSQELRGACRWIVGLRPGQPLPKTGLPAHLVLKGKFPDISSSEIRSRLLAGLSTRKMLSKGIRDYIAAHSLYHLWIPADLKSSLSKDRFDHTLAVTRLAYQLAERHNLNLHSAVLAGLLHDAGRRFQPQSMVRYAARHRLKVPGLKGIVRNAPVLLHAYVGERLARTRFGVKDREALQAIRRHTLGAVPMAPLDKLLFVADAASEDRGFSSAGRIRAMALKNLDKAFKFAVRSKMLYIRRHGLWEHPLGKKLEEWALSL